MNDKKITQKELDKILKKHKKWLDGDHNGECAYLRGADLSGANLCGADLSGANLSDANLRGADLSGANLSDANLRGAYLSDANLCYAYLRGADLSGAYLYDANLRGANLSGANLRGANLRCAYLYDAYLRGAYLSGADLIGANLSDANLSDANLSDANLRDANLRGAYLSDANLSDANLRGADLSGADNIYHPIACPEKGSFIGFKKAGRGHNIIVELEITEDALRCSATTRKCRCSKAKVLSFTNLDGTPTDVTEVVSDYDKSFVYKIGEYVQVDNFDENRWNECSTGIHFFITRQEAVDY